MENSKKSASKKIDFDAINSLALNRSDFILHTYLPGGKQEGAEYVVSNPTRNDVHPSLKINIAKGGVWSDFPTGDKGGDLNVIKLRTNSLNMI